MENFHFQINLNYNYKFHYDKGNLEFASLDLQGKGLLQAQKRYKET